MPFNKGLALLQFLLTYLVGYAQTPIDQIVIPAKNAGVQVFYERGSFKKYWEGTNLRENGNIGTVIRTSVQPSLFVGITDKLNFYAGMPYIRKVSAEPNGGHLDKTYGFQDLNLALKYEILRKRKAGNELSVLSTLGFSTRLTNYSSDNGFYSLGLGVPEVSARGIIA